MRSDVERYITMAKCRDDTVIAEREKRIEIRKHERKSRGALNNHDEGIADRDKVRALISAIRAHTNTDIDFNTRMSPNTLFKQAAIALNGQCTQTAAKESKFIGSRRP